MNDVPMNDHRLVRAAALAADRDPAPPPVPTGDECPLWRPAELAGRLCELAAAPHGVHLTLACTIIRSFQLAAEPVAWVTNARAMFFPPDVAGSGADLAALPVVQVPDLAAVVAAADRLTRSGAFGLVLLELDAGTGGGGVPAAVLGRLVRLARRHDTALLCLTTPGIALGSPVSLRGRGFRSAAPWPGYACCGIHVLKDRRRAPGGSLTALYRAPYGLC